MSNRKGVLLAIMLFVLALVSVSTIRSASAQESYNIDISVKAGNIDGYNSRFSIYDFSAQNKTVGNQVIGSNNMLKFSLVGGYYEITAGVDDPVTPGFDYYGTISFNADSDKYLEMDAVPVGSRRIEVLDMNGKPLSGIPVRIDCDTLAGEQGYFRTDGFGIVEASFLPIGKCTFRAVAGDSIINSEDRIDKGSTKSIIMSFSDYSKDRPGVSWISVLIIALIILTAIYILTLRVKKGKTSNKDVKKDPNIDIKKGVAKDIAAEAPVSGDSNNTADIENSGSQSRSIKKDIMTALNSNERKVVNFLLEEQEKHLSENKSPKGFYLHQAIIVHGTGIAKTTLVRLLQSLEQKKIIEWERSGKIKKVRLTEWFDSK